MMDHDAARLYTAQRRVVPYRAVTHLKQKLLDLLQRNAIDRCLNSCLKLVGKPGMLLDFYRENAKFHNTV